MSPKKVKGNEAKKALFQRLKSSLPKNSPPQIILFDGFYQGYGKAVPSMPALLPEVWLHWDHKTVLERDVEALLNFRIHFLLLLPGGVRVVIEVDGKQHYANSSSREDPSRYAKLVEGDRDLKLSGYQAFRFGAVELSDNTSKNKVKDFFYALFRFYGK